MSSSLTRQMSMLAKLGLRSMSFLVKTRIDIKLPKKNVKHCLPKSFKKNSFFMESKNSTPHTLILVDDRKKLHLWLFVFMRYIHITKEKNKKLIEDKHTYKLRVSLGWKSILFNWVCESYVKSNLIMFYSQLWQT